MEFWERVLALVVKQETTFRYLAEKIGVSETTMSGWKRTNVLPRADHSVAIASALGVSVEYLVTGKESGSRYDAALAARPDLRSIVDALFSLDRAQITAIDTIVSGCAGGTDKTVEHGENRRLG
jgi:transcriptional regulator with XRE-family HTH domain